MLREKSAINHPERKLKNTFIHEVMPLQEQVKFNGEILAAIEELQHFLPIVAKQLSKDDDLKDKLFHLSKSNRRTSIIRTAEGLKGKKKEKIENVSDLVDYQEPSEEPISDNSHLRSEIITVLHNEFDNIFRIIERLPEETDTNAVVNVFVDTVADYLRFGSKAAVLNDKMFGFYFGIGVGILGRISDLRLPNKVLAATNYSPSNETTVDEKKDGTNILHSELTLKQIQDEVKLEVALLDEKTSILVFNNWLRIAAKEKRRIAGTEWDEQNVQAILKTRQLTNGTAGVIAHGPPGTGKTELFIEANRRDGFETYVVSLHEFSGFIQLIGEAPVKLGYDKGGSALDQAIKFRDAVKDMDEEEFIKATDLLGLNNEQLLAYAHINPSEKINPDERENFLKIVKNGLISYANKTILSIQLTGETDISEESWVKGEILEAWSQGKQVLLDEADKAGPEAFNGISYILGAPPGSTISLRGDEYTIPSWARIDATANAMNLADFLQDRFTSSIMEINYAPTDDLMKKVAFWLADDDGRISLSFDTQSKVVAFFSYVVPQIQHLYALNQENNNNGISNPMSYRSMSKMCQALKLSPGENFSKIIHDFILKKGALVSNEAELQALKKILDKFPELTVANIQTQKPEITKGPNGILRSPILGAATVGPGRASVREGIIYGEVNLKDAQIDILLVDKTKKLARYGVNDQTLNNNMTVKIDRDSNTINFIDLNGKNLITRSLPESLANAALIGADSHGQKLLFKENGEVPNITVYCLLTNSVEAAGIKFSQAINGDVYLSSDGTNIKEFYDNEFVMTVLAQKGENKRIEVFDTTSGSQAIIERWSENSDGSLILLETKGESTYVLDASSVISQGKILLKTPIDFKNLDGNAPEIGWELGANNILFHQEYEAGFVIK